MEFRALSFKASVKAGRSRVEREDRCLDSTEAVPSIGAEMRFRSARNRRISQSTAGVFHPERSRGLSTLFLLSEKPATRAICRARNSGSPFIIHITDLRAWHEREKKKKAEESGRTFCGRQVVLANGKA